MSTAKGPLVRQNLTIALMMLVCKSIGAMRVVYRPDNGSPRYSLNSVAQALNPII